jgi:hypothetical protein
MLTLADALLTTPFENNHFILKACVKPFEHPLKT